MESMPTDDSGAQPGVAVERHQPAPPHRPEPLSLSAAIDLGQRLCRTDFVPVALRGKAEAVLAAILYGNEIGLGPMQALQSVQVIQGKTGLAPEAMRALVLREGHVLSVRSATAEACTMYGRRRDTGEELELEWTIQMARSADLVKPRGGWATFPRAMLVARCTAELCRYLFPDVIGGLSYTPDELAGMGDGAIYELDENGEQGQVFDRRAVWSDLRDRKAALPAEAQERITAWAVAADCTPSSFSPGLAEALTEMIVSEEDAVADVTDAEIVPSAGQEGGQEAPAAPDAPDAAAEPLDGICGSVHPESADAEEPVICDKPRSHPDEDGHEDSTVGIAWAADGTIIEVAEVVEAPAHDATLTIKAEVEAAVARLDSKRQVVDQLRDRNLSTTGSETLLRARLADAMEAEAVAPEQPSPDALPLEG